MTRPVVAAIPVSFAYGRRYKNGTIHKGIDYSDGREGHAVRSMLPGVVIHAGYGGWGSAYGQHVVIKSPASVLGAVRYTLLGHLKTETVKVGQHVAAGETIGTVGGRAGQRYSGNSTGPHVHAQLCYQNRYDRYLDPAPAIAYKATAEQPASAWFGAVGWNWAVSDPVRGRATWAKRLPGLCKALTHYDRDVVMLVEACTPAQLPTLKAAVGAVGYAVAVYSAGRCILVRKGMKIGRTKAVTLKARANGDAKHVVIAEVFPGTGTAAALVECGHFENQDGELYEATRKAQATETRQLNENSCKAWAIPLDRVIAYNDENARTGVNSAFGTSWPDLATHAPAYGNLTYSTLVTWSGVTVKNGYRPDKIRVHKSRPVIGGSTSLTFADAELTDHLPVVATLARITKGNT